jgi:ABC-type multidrug transport system fused ATPase/permease subunit
MSLRIDVPVIPFEDPDYEEQISRAQAMKSYSHSPPMRPELIVFGLKDWVVKEYQKSSAIAAEMEKPVDPYNFRNQLFDHLTNVAQTGSRAIMYLLIALKADYFDTPLASLTYIEQSSQSLFKRTYSMWQRTGYMLRDLMSIQELFECMDIQPSMKIPENPVAYESASFGNGTGMKIEVKGVSYKYPGKNDFVLKDISFVLQAGETLALLGFNGSGISI